MTSESGRSPANGCSRAGPEIGDLAFDALTLAVSADPKAAIVTIETVRRLTDELGVNTILGVSNVSFGLPNRPALNNAMYTLCVKAGLSTAIANPALIRKSAGEMLAGGASPMGVIEKGIVPALEQIGTAFEKGTAFLPQLLMAADAAGDAFAVVRKSLGSSAKGDSAMQSVRIAERVLKKV